MARTSTILCAAFFLIAMPHAFADGGWSPDPDWRTRMGWEERMLQKGGRGPLGDSPSENSVNLSGESRIDDTDSSGGGSGGGGTTSGSVLYRGPQGEPPSWMSSPNASGGCEKGKFFDPGSGKCAPDPLPCPNGFHYDPMSIRCLSDELSCPKGTYRDPTTNKCNDIPASLKLPDGLQCPDGQVFDREYMQCATIIESVTCAANERLDPEQNRCVAIECERGTYDAASGGCTYTAPECTGGTVRDPKTLECKAIAQMAGTQCPAGEIYLPYTRRCSKIQCQEGYLYDNAVQSCVPITPGSCKRGEVYTINQVTNTQGCAPVQCPAGSSFYLNANNCVPTAQQSCHTGQRFVNGRCVDVTSCPDGQVFNINLGEFGQCVSPNCKRGEIYDFTTASCAQWSCPAGSSYYLNADLNANPCVPTANQTCHTGQRYNGSQCVDVTCADGKVFNINLGQHGECTAPPNCARGQAYSYATASCGPYSCPQGWSYYINADQCVPTAQQSCHTGQRFVNGQCVDVTSCPDGQVFNINLGEFGQCVSPNCKRGEIYDFTTASCAQWSCPAGSSYYLNADLNANPCVPTANQTCHTGQRYNGSQCVDVTCADGKVFNINLGQHGECTTPPNCARGQAYSYATASCGPYSCPQGWSYYINADQCVPTAQQSCHTGQRFVNGQCVDVTSCPDGQVFNINLGVAGECTSPNCAANESYSFVTASCVPL